MATASTSPKLSHEERTADSLRDVLPHVVSVTNIQQINPYIRIIRLKPIDKSKNINFLPGQWLDVFVPGVQKAGGFTITSAPRDAASSPSKQSQGHVELAIQKSPNNPPAAWLWRSHNEVLGTGLTVRVGGNFVWPPPLNEMPGAKEWSESPMDQRHVVLLAGGVGINPLMSIFTHLHHDHTPLRSLTLLYATKSAINPDGSDILFVPRIHDLATADAASTASKSRTLSIQLFITPPATHEQQTKEDEATATIAEAGAVVSSLPFQRRRITLADIEAALPRDAEARRRTVVYVCGPRGFTDGFVEAVSAAEGMHADRVFCEKWW